jgi:hypothetical protein
MKFCIFNEDGSMQALIERFSLDDAPEEFVPVPEEMEAGQHFYFSGGEVHVSQAMQLEVAPPVISNIPNGTRVLVRGIESICTDGFVEIENLAGVPVIVSLTHPRFKPETVTL